MLGVRRAGVTEAAVKMKEAGLITYKRGDIQILDRARLEAASCECYERAKVEYGRLFTTWPRPADLMTPAMSGL